MNFFRRRHSLYFLMVFISFTLSGCYEDYINIFVEFTPGIYNRSRTEIAFYQFLSAGMPPKGISRFPDGGSHEVIFKKVTFYRYNVETGKLKDLFVYGNLPSNVGGWREDIAWKQNKIAFSISPVSGWEWMMEHSTNPQYNMLQDKYNGIFVYDLDKETVSRVTKRGIEPAFSPDSYSIAYLLPDSIKTDLWIFNPDTQDNQFIFTLSEGDEYPPYLFWSDENNILLSHGKKYSVLNLENKTLTMTDEEMKGESNKIGQSDIIEITNSIPFREWGLDLHSVWPRKKKDYIQDIIRLNGNLNYRKAIIEEIGNELDIGEIEKIIDKMTRYQNSLEGTEKMNYEIFSEETKDLLFQLLENE